MYSSFKSRRAHWHTRAEEYDTHPLFQDRKRKLNKVEVRSRDKFYWNLIKLMMHRFSRDDVILRTLADEILNFGIYKKIENLKKRQLSSLALRVLLCPVVGRSRPAVNACRTVRSGVFHHWIHHLWPQGAVPPGFNPLRRGWVYRPAPEAPRKGKCRRGPRHFWNCLPRWASALR